MSKMNWKKVIGWTVAVVALIAVIGTNIYQYQKDLKTDKPVVKIGVTLPLTGAMARVGQEAKHAMELRISEVKSDSKYDYNLIFEDGQSQTPEESPNTHKPINFNLIFEDDQFQAAKEFSNAQKLINFNHVDVIISGFSGSAAAIAKLAKERQVVDWNFQWTDEVAKSSPFSFTYMQRPSEVIKVWMDAAYKKGYRRIAIVNNDTHAGGEYLISEAKKLLSNYSGMEIVSIERVPLFGSDLRTTLLKINSKRPDIYLAFLLSPTLDEFAKRMKEQEINTPISTINRFDHAKEKALFEGNWGVGANDYNTNVIANYVNKYHEEDMSEMAKHAYDAMDIIVHAYEENDVKPDAKKLAGTLLQMHGYKSGFGVTKLDSNGIFSIPLIVGKVKNGQFVPVESEEE